MPAVNRTSASQSLLPEAPSASRCSAPRSLRAKHAARLLDGAELLRSASFCFRGDRFTLSSFQRRAASRRSVPADLSLKERASIGGRMADFQDHPTAVRLGEELDVGKLELFLRGHFRNEAGAMRVEQFPNGHSNLTYAIRFGESRIRPAPPALRQQSEIRTRHEPRVSRAVETACVLSARTRSCAVLRRPVGSRCALLLDETDLGNYSASRSAGWVGFFSGHRSPP